MSFSKHPQSRRTFLKAIGTASAGALCTSLNSSVAAARGAATMPTRQYGKSGVRVAILSFGGSLDTSLSLLVLRQAFKWGVTYWDTANSYMGGRSEQGMGKYIEKFPEDRKRIFLVTKSHAWTLKGMSRDLDESLERLKTNYVDLFFVHSVRSPTDLNADMKAWADKKKAQGKIRLFGFSTHSNMEACMLAAARLGWIDGIMMSYNYRRMHTDNMKKAVAACSGAGIGLTAMKTQGGGQIKTNMPSELQMASRFLSKGFTGAQAKLKAVWSNPAISSICSEMPNMTILKANVAAALDRTTLSYRDMDLLQHHAWKTRAHYCAGCTAICESSAPGSFPVGKIMRCLMYARSYGDHFRAKVEFRDIPASVRDQLATLDYAAAERQCPQNMPIGQLMAEAVEELS